MKFSNIELTMKMSDIVKKMSKMNASVLLDTGEEFIFWAALTHPEILKEFFKTSENLPTVFQKEVLLMDNEV